MKFWTIKDLSNSQTYKTNWNIHCFELFKLHFPNKYSERKGYKIIWRDSANTELSLFNRLGTNYTSYAYLINKTLDEMKDENIDPTKPDGYLQIINYLKSNKEFFKSLLPEIGAILKEIDKRGSLYEEMADEAIKHFFGENVQIETTAGLGQYKDTILGIDKIITVNGKKLSIQVKGVYNIFPISYKNLYRVVLYHKRIYTVDYMMFKYKTEFYLFKNIGITADDKGYIIPSSSLVDTYNHRSTTQDQEEIPE